MKRHHLAFLAVAVILILGFGGGDASRAASSPDRGEAAPAALAPRSPNLTPTPTPTPEPELAILQYVVAAHPGWMCQGPTGPPGHRQITGCSPYSNFTHPTSGYVDNYGSPSAAQAEWANRRAVAQSLYPSFADTTYNGYDGYHANNTAYPYAHYEEYYWGSSWVLGAVSSDDTHFWGGPYVAHAIMDAAAALGYLPGGGTTPTVTPTATVTRTPTIPPIPTITVTPPPCCNGLSAAGLAVCIVSGNYDYSLEVMNNCVAHLSGTVTIYRELSPNQSGPWTVYDSMGPTPMIFPAGSTTILNDHFAPGPLPPQYQWWRVRLHIDQTCPPPLDYATGAQPVCQANATLTPTLPTGTPTAMPNTPLPTYTPTETASRTSTPTVTGTPPTPCPISFNDVPPGSTFYDYVQWLACRGTVGGYPCGGPGEPCPGTYYRPQNNVTRGQLAKIIANTAQYTETPTGQTFEDVPPSQPFYPWIERIALRSIVAGYQCNVAPGEPCIPPGNRAYYRPNNDTTRGQIAKIVSEARGYSDPPTTQSFEDVPPTNTFYLYAERLTGRGIITGYPCGGPLEPCVAPGNRPYFRPNNATTRGQVAKIITLAYDGGP